LTVVLSQDRRGRQLQRQAHESYRGFRRDSRTGEIRDEPGIAKYWYCDTGKTTWKAKSP
jgi:hypothetical protein